MERISARTSAPGGGAVASTTAALAASLAAMAARFSTEHMEDADELAERADSLRDRASYLAQADAEVYGRVLEAKRSGGSVRAALSDAADIPLVAAEAAAEVFRISTRLASEGNPNLRGDALTAGFLAGASVRAAATLVEINLRAAGMDDDPRFRRASELARKVAERSERVADNETYEV